MASEKKVNLISDTDIIICEYVGKSKPLIGIFLTVDKQILLYTIEDIGMKGTQHDLFGCYLSNKTQAVRISNRISEETIMTFLYSEKRCSTLYFPTFIWIHFS